MVRRRGAAQAPVRPTIAPVIATRGRASRGTRRSPSASEARGALTVHLLELQGLGLEIEPVRAVAGQQHDRREAHESGRVVGMTPDTVSQLTAKRAQVDTHERDPRELGHADRRSEEMVGARVWRCDGERHGPLPVS